jgi:hypothetical protein
VQATKHLSVQVDFRRAKITVSNAPSFTEGEKVRHAKFGIGEIVESTDDRVVVKFGEQERRFVPQIAPLSKIAVSDE